MQVLSSITRSRVIVEVYSCMSTFQKNIHQNGFLFGRELQQPSFFPVQPWSVSGIVARGTLKIQLAAKVDILESRTTNVEYSLPSSKNTAKKRDKNFLVIP